MLGTSKSVWGFDPRSILGCQLWLDGRDVSVLFSDVAGTSAITTNGQTIRCWKDKSGRGCNATQAGNAPIWNSSNYVNFTQTLGQSMNLPNGTLPFASGTNAYSIFAVASLNNTSSGLKTIIGNGVAGNNSFNALQIQTQSIANLWYSNDIAGGSLTANTFFIANIAFDGSTRYIYQTGISVNTTASSGWAAPNTNNVIGVEPATGNWYYDGNIGEILVYNTALTTSQRQQVEGYLAHKWGLTASYSQTVPLTIPGCQLWLDGRDTSSMTFSGSTITQWNDKSGNGYNATIAPDRIGAVYSTTYNAVNFATSTTGYITNYSAAPTNETMFVVGNNPSPSGANNIIIGGVSGARSLGLGYSNPNGTGTIGNLNTQVAWLATVGGYTSGTTALVRSQFTPSSNSVSFNGGSTGTGGAPGFTAGRVTYLGVDATNGYYHYNGYMMEALFYNRILTTTEIQTIEGYLAKKWGIGSSSMIPSTHPFSKIPPHLRVFQPNDVTGCSLWLDAADSSTITGTTSVTAWRDKSGNGNNAVFTGTNPSYTPANKYVETSNLNQEFSVPGTIFNTVGGSLFIVYADKQQNTQNGMLYAISSGYTPHLFDQCLFRADGYSYALGGVDGPGNTFKTALNTKNTLLYSINYVHNTVNYTVTVNGTVFPFTSSGVVVPSGSLVFSGGWGGAANIKFNEIIFFNSVLTTSQRETIEWYLANKWGIFSTSPVSTPLTIPGCGIWLDGADTSSMTFSSGAITQWRDKSSSSNHFGLTRGTATSILDNGRSVVNFGEATVMTSTNSISFTTSSAFFIVSKMTSTNGAQDLLGFPSFGNGFALRFFSSILYSGNGDDLSLGNYYVNGNFNPSYPSTTYYNTYSLISTLVPSRGGTTLISLSDNWLLEGHAQRFFIGNIAEFIFYPGGVTNIQRQKIEGYLANKWGLTVPAPTVHPYDKFPPASLHSSERFPLIRTSELIVKLDGASYSAGGSTWKDSVASANWTMAGTTYDATTQSVVFSSSYAYAPSVTNFNSSAHTVVMYYYRTGNSPNPGGIATTGAVLYQIARGDNTMSEILIYEPTVWEYYGSFTLSFDANTSLSGTTGWVMRAFVKNGGTGTFYLNGLADGTQTVGTAVPTENRDFCIGRDYRDSNSFLQGKVALFAMWNVALSASEIAAVHANCRGQFGL